jgi:hypothetical protein
LLLLPPRHSQTFTRARRHGGPRGIGSGCEIHSAREEGHDTNCIKYRTSARLLPLESLARGCSGSKFFSAPGPAVQGRSSRAPSPARPSLDLDHTLLFALDFSAVFSQVVFMTQRLSLCHEHNLTEHCRKMLCTDSEWRPPLPKYVRGAYFYMKETLQQFTRQVRRRWRAEAQLAPPEELLGRMGR